MTGLHFNGDNQCPATNFPISAVRKTRHLKATKRNGSKSRAKIIGEQSFVCGGEGIDDFQTVDLKTVLHIFR